jgi:exonuclease V gamma subunit
MPNPDNPPSPVVLPDAVRRRLLDAQAMTPPLDIAPLLAKLDTLTDALNAHTVAVYQWADACNALLNAMLETAEDESEFLTDLKGNRIELGNAQHADRAAKP